jgi:hypothetical protein
MGEAREAPARSRAPRQVRRSVTAAAFGGALVLPFAGSAVAAVPVCACGGGGTPDADPPAPDPIDAQATTEAQPVPEHQPAPPPDPKAAEHQALRPTPEPLAAEPSGPEPEPAVEPEPVVEPAEPAEPAAAAEPPEPSPYAGMSANAAERWAESEGSAAEPTPEPSEPEPSPAAGPEPEPVVEPAEPAAAAEPPEPSPYAGMSANAAERWAESEGSAAEPTPEPSEPEPSHAAGPEAEPAPEPEPAVEPEPVVELAEPAEPAAAAEPPEPSPYAGMSANAAEHRADPDSSTVEPTSEPAVPETAPAPESSDVAAMPLSEPIEHTFSTGWCPLGHNPNGSCRGSGAASAVADTVGDVAERTWDVTRFAANAPITGPTWVWAEANGGNCGFDPGLVVACEDVNSWANGPRGALTVGGVVLYEDEGSEISDAERRHEERHTDQWALFGLGLVPAYYANEGVSQVTGHGSCWNLFERWAGFEDGGYDECE